ncbi:unnamed protein product [Pelagomonas calceolata]|uniref:Uncharacterized protein n=1 Tax=Pelagomonas calceolata TaxID=35677 RepID=A0A8J2SXV2_9STRA|nr:unnamed protein product [Pelagomonas calceolata]
MEAHHAPNWSRKQHVDGAHDKPSATSGSHGRRPHNATKPKTKHAPIDGEAWSHADARAARLGRTESLSGYLFGSAFSAPERQRPAEENRRLWPEEHDEDAATYFTPFDEGRSGVRPDGPETTSTGENKFHLEFQGNHEPHDGECEAVRLPGEDHRPIDEDEPLYAGNVRLAEVLGERKESFDLTPRFYGPDEARAHVLERDEPQPEFDVAGHVRLKPALHEETPDLLALVGPG